MDRAGIAPDSLVESILRGLYDELRLVEDEIDQLRRATAEIHQRFGERDEGVTDIKERTATIEQLEVQGALLGILTARRDQLRDRLRAVSETAT